MAYSQIRIALVPKSDFIGAYSLCPAPRSFIEEWGFADLKGIESEYMPVLGFRDLSRKSYNYELEEHELNDCFWNDAVCQSTCLGSKASPSVKFSNLETPNDYLTFARRFGNLGGSFLLHKRPGDFDLFPISKLSVYPLFGYKDGPKRASAYFDEAFHVTGESSKVDCYESFADWIQASSLMRFAYYAQSAIKGHIDYRVENHSGGSPYLLVRLPDSKKAILIAPFDGDFLRVPLRLADAVTPVASIAGNDQMRRDSGYAEFLNRSNFEDDIRIKGEVFRSDLNDIDMLVELPSLGDLTGLTEDDVRDAMSSIVSLLVAKHEVSMRLTLFDGSFSYSCDSLPSYLWIDFARNASGSMEMGSCAFCGKPFFRNNRGYKRIYCSTLCRNNARNRKNRA